LLHTAPMTPLPPPCALHEISALIGRAEELLREAEAAWPQLLVIAAGGVESRETDALEDLLHVATHETASQLGLALQEMTRHLARLELRRQYTMFSPAEFDMIVARGWSTPLVGELHGAHPAISLREFSALVKRLCAEWGS
jgi:hypothetical protein